MSPARTPSKSAIALLLCFGLIPAIGPQAVAQGTPDQDRGKASAGSLNPAHGILSVTNRQRVAIYDVATGTQVSTFQGRSAYRAINGETIIGVTGNGVESWDATTTVVIGVDGSRREIVGQHSSVHPPILSPDASLVAMTFRQNPRSGGRDGTLIYRRDGRPQLHRSEGDMGPRIAFFPNTVPEDWTPDGRLIATCEVPIEARALLTEGDENWLCISTPRLDSLLIINRQLSGKDPSVSPNGKQLAYVHAGNVWIAGIDGSQPRQVTKGKYLEHPRGPAWSPDGRLLAVQGDEGASVAGISHVYTYVYLVSTTGVNQPLITKLLDAEGAPILADTHRPSWRGRAPEPPGFRK